MVSIASLWLPDNQHIISGSWDKSVRMWDVKTGRLIHIFEGNPGPVHAVAVSKDGTFVVSGGNDGIVRGWDVKSGKLIAKLEGHGGWVRGVAFLPDGRLISGGGDGLRIWDLATEKDHLEISHAGRSAERWREMAVSRDGKKVAYVRLWHPYSTHVVDIVTGKQLADLGVTPWLPVHVAFSSDGNQIFTSTGDPSRLGRFDIATGKQVPTPDDLMNTRSAVLSPGRQSRVLRFNGHSPVGHGQR